MAAKKWTIVCHGGAGVLDRASLLYPEARYISALRRAALAAAKIVCDGGPAVRAAVAAVEVLEDDEVFNAGHGAVLASDGTVECEASVMDGRTRACGSVIGIKHTRNPVRAAEAVMKGCPHSVLAGHSADDFARAQGLTMCEQEYYITAPRAKQLTDTKGEEHGRAVLDHGDARGTVGAVVCDMAGAVAAASSTGGMTNKWPGRVGDTPLIGCGLLATPHVAVCATGRGEAFVQHASSARVAFTAPTLGLEEAVRATLGDMVHGDGGLIAVDSTGAWTAQFTTGGMLRVVFTPEMAEPDASIW